MFKNKGVSPIKSNAKKERNSNGEFKSKFLSVIQKTVVIILACLMVLSILPIELIRDRDTQEPVGEYMRISPSDEIYSVSDSESGTAGIGLGGGAYLKFSLERLKELKPEEIKSVHLRLAFLNGNGAKGGEVTVSLPPSGIIPEKNPNVYLPSEKVIETLCPQTGGASDSLSQLDLTEYTKELLSSGITELSVRLTGKASIHTLLASSSYSDPAYRPCLSAVTGIAENEASSSLDKAVLKDSTYVSKIDGGSKGTDLTPLGDFLIVDESRETYLKFEIDEKAILGTPYKAVLSLGRIGIGSKPGADKIKIYCINNDEWTSGDISYDNRPRGDESTASSIFATAKRQDGRINFDVSQTVCDAISHGIKTLTFRITGEDNDDSIYISGAKGGTNAPMLYIKATDDKHISAAANAALCALGSNRQSFVTMNLETSYRSDDGTEARIRWKEYNAAAEDITDRHIRENGEIIRPKWFEGNAYTLAVAKIRSGSYETEREYWLNIPSASVPDYSKYKFRNYIDIGNDKSEDGQKFDFVNFSSSKRRWKGGRMFSYRIPEKDGVAVLNLACEPNSNNYLTLKLWEGDDSQAQKFTVGTVDGEPIILNSPPESTEREGGFIYATYALPRSFTDNKGFVSLRLSCIENLDAEYKPRGIYAAYMTQSPYFEPKLFADQGEKTVSEPLFGDGAIQRFIDNLHSSDAPLNFEIEEPEPTTQYFSIDDESGIIVTTGIDTNIAFAVDENKGAANVYQRLEYYDRYSSGVPVISQNGLVSVDYGNYKLIWNRHGTTGKKIPIEQLEISGEYKDIINDKYYSFSEELPGAEDNLIPDDTEWHTGSELTVLPQEVVILVRIQNPSGGSDWRVNSVNGKPTPTLSFENGEQIKTVTVRSVGDINEDAENITVMLCISRNGKLISMAKKKTELSQSVNIYTVDFTESELYMNKGYELKILVYDDTTDMTKLEPKLEIM